MGSPSDLKIETEGKSLSLPGEEVELNTGSLNVLMPKTQNWCSLIMMVFRWQKNLIKFRKKFNVIEVFVLF